MGKKSKRDKPPKIKNSIVTLKTFEERQTEIKELKDKIENLGLSDNFEGIDKFYQLLDQFVNEGLDLSGKIEIPGVQRAIVYELYGQSQKFNQVNLKYVSDI